MAIIKPFMAVRPKAGMESEISSLPYDVFNRKEAKEYVKTHANSFLKIDRAESTLPDSVDTYDDAVYENAVNIYKSMKDEGLFVKESKPCFYLYEEIMDGRSQTGLVCTAGVDDYVGNIIKKHENTRADKEIDRINHVDRLSAHTGPIFLACRDNEELQDIFNEVKKNPPYFDFTDEYGITEKGYLIDDDTMIKRLLDLFNNIKELYIADGHHRCASAAKVCLKRREEAASFSGNEEFNFILSMVFPASELKIMDYNRVIKKLNMSKEDFLNKLNVKFNVKEIESTLNKPEKKGDIYLIFKDSEYLIRLKDEFMDKGPVETLDVSVLQKHVLSEILGIKDPKTDSNIDFVGGIRGIKELKKRLDTDAEACFAMFPTSLNELFNVADAGLLMPPKSTWFEPKLRSGLFIHEI